MHRSAPLPSVPGSPGHRLLRRPLAGLVAALCLAASVAPPVGAQDAAAQASSTTTAAPTTTTTTVAPTTTSTAPTTTSTAPSGSPTTTTPTSSTTSDPAGAGSTTSSSVPVVNEVCAPVDPAAEPTTNTEPGAVEGEVPCDPPLFDIDGDGILDEVTPEIDPGQTEDEADGPPPQVTVTIPPPNKYDNAVEWTPSVALVSDIESAREKFDQADARLTRVVGTIKSFRLQAKRLGIDLTELDAESQATILALEQAEDRMRFRATNAFMDGDEVTFEANGDFGQVPDDQAQQTVVEIVFETDRALIAAHQADESANADSTRRLRERTRLLERSLDAAENEVEEARADLEQAAKELEAFEAGSGVYISGVTFPIAWPYSLPLINSWGYPRSGGRRHEGIDIFAAAGTPLVATERGVVTRIGNGTLGGLRLWLRGESGTDWYYAHLSAFAPGLSENQVVEVGELIGYVGNTGNAIGTPPHLHMQIHPNGGDPVNPYPLLKLVSDNEIEAREIEARELAEAE